jgi:hypothetical protein
MSTQQPTLNEKREIYHPADGAFFNGRLFRRLRRHLALCEILVKGVLNVLDMDHR